MSGGATEDAQAINVAQDAPGDVITTSGAFTLFPPLRGLELANTRIMTPRIAIASGISREKDRDCFGY